MKHPVGTTFTIYLAKEYNDIPWEERKSKPNPYLKPFHEFIKYDSGQWKITKYIITDDGAHKTTWTKVSEYDSFGGQDNIICPYCGYEANASDYPYWESEIYSADDDVGWEECSECEKHFQVHVTCDRISGRTIETAPAEWPFDKDLKDYL